MTSSFYFNIIGSIWCSSSGFISLTVKLNSEPFPYSDFTVMDPPNYSAIFLDITSPRPIPCVLTPFKFCTYPNSLNSFCLSWSLIPTPVSLTEILRYNWWLLFDDESIYMFGLPCYGSIWFYSITADFSMLTVILTSPSRVYFKAFDYRFNKIYLILCSSWTILGLLPLLW